MSDRLTELQRQRALAQEQVAWFDREIAREAGERPKPHASAVSPVATASLADASPRSGGIPSSVPSADDLLKQYQGSGRSIQSEVKRGCFMYFFAAFGLLAVGIAVFYLVWRS